jgi:DHA2 family multidrug resistance protein
VIALAVFLTAEFSVKAPLIDLRLLGNFNFAIANLTMFIFGIGMFGSTFLLPLYLQNTLGYTAIQSGAVFLPVGIIQGTVAPIIGKVADKTSAKIPILIGVALLALSFYLNSSMSFLTEHAAIMASLYLRGFSMGLIFTPLSSLSLSDIPREKMAQASGISNVIRQLGGSFGVAILATLLTTRVSYHTEMFGESVMPHSETYQNVTKNIRQAAIYNSGSSPANASKLSQMGVVTQLNKEAYIQGVDDDFLIACFITLISGIPIIFLREKKKVPHIKHAHHEKK